MCQQKHTAASGGGGGVLHVSSYHYKCVLIILNVSSYTAQKKTVPTKTVNVSSYYYKCVLIILNVSSYTAKTKKTAVFGGVGGGGGHH
jgi:hypothetical protein